MFKKLLASVLALACVLTVNVTAFAATTPTPGSLVDSDGNVAMNSSQNIKPGDDYYYIIGRSDLGYDTYTNKDNFNFSLKKVEGGKYISGGELVEKRFNNVRFVCIAFTIKDSYSSSEYKLVLDANFRARKDMVATNGTSLNSDFPIFKPGNLPGGGTNDAAIAAAKLAWENAKVAASTAQTAYNKAVVDTDAAKKLWDTSKIAADLQNQIQKELIRLGNVADQAKKDHTTAVGNVATAKQAVTDKVNTTTNNIDTANLEIEKLKTRQTAINKIVTLFDLQTSTIVADINTEIGKYNTLYTTTLASLPTDGSIADITMVNKTAYTTESTTTVPTLTAAQNKIVLDNQTDASTNLPILKEAVTAAEKTAALALTAKDNAIAALNAQAAKIPPTTFAIVDYEINYNDAVAAQATAGTNLNNANNLVTSTLANYNAQLALVPGTGYLKSGDTKATRFSVWIQNEQRTDSDATIVVGEKGVVIRPEKNERNTVTWETSGGDPVARMVFTADSSASFYSPQLTTKLDSKADYYDYFIDRDAYMFNFVGNPRIPATTRVSLSLYNPFRDRDGEVSKHARNLYVYQLVDGELTNVTDKFTPDENDDGYEVLTTRTITLGTYIVTDRSVRLVDNNNNTPAKPNDNIDSGMLYPSGNKPIPNTGR